MNKCIKQSINTTKLAAPKLLGCFGWKEEADPPSAATSQLLLDHFRKRLELPGRPARLVEPFPRSLQIIPRKQEHPATKYDRPPVVAILMAAIHHDKTFSLNDVAFVTPRRNIQKMALMESGKGVVIDVQRRHGEPIYIDRVIEYYAVDKGDAGHLFEKAMTRVEAHSDQFRTLLITELASFRILLSGEVDATTDAFKPDSTDSKQLAHLTELKTIWDNNARLLAERGPGWWLQSAIVGTPNLLVGFKSNPYRGAPQVNMRVEMRAVSGLVSEGVKQRLLAQLVSNLKWLQDEIPEDGNVYRIDIRNKSKALVDKHQGDIVSKDMLIGLGLLEKG
jgi:hypothetical protein